MQRINPLIKRLLLLFVLCTFSTAVDALPMTELIEHVKEANTLSKESNSIEELDAKKAELQKIIDSGDASAPTLQSLVTMLENRKTELTEAAQKAEEDKKKAAEAAAEAEAALEAAKFPHVLTLPAADTQNWEVTVTVNTTKDIILTLNEGATGDSPPVKVTISMGGTDISPTITAEDGKKYVLYNGVWQTSSAPADRTVRFMNDGAKLTSGQTAYWFGFSGGMLAGGRGTGSSAESLGFVWKLRAISGEPYTVTSATLSSTHPTLAAHAPPTVTPTLAATAGGMLTDKLTTLLTPKATTSNEEKVVMQNIRTGLGITAAGIPTMQKLNAQESRELTIPAEAQGSWFTTLTSADLKGLKVVITLNDGTKAALDVGLHNNFISRMTVPAAFLPDSETAGYMFSRDPNYGFQYNYWRRETTNAALTPARSVNWHGGATTKNAQAVLRSTGEATYWFGFSKGLFAFGHGDNPSGGTVGMLWRVGPEDSTVTTATLTNSATTATTLQNLKTAAAPAGTTELLTKKLDLIAPSSTHTGDDSMAAENRLPLKNEQKEIIKSLRKALNLTVADDFIVTEKLIALPAGTATTIFPHNDLGIALPASGGAQWAYAFKMKGNETENTYNTTDDFAGTIQLLGADGKTAARLTIGPMTATLAVLSDAAQKYAFTRSTHGEWTSAESDDAFDTVIFKGAFNPIQGNGMLENATEHYLIFADGILALRRGTNVVLSWQVGDALKNIASIKMTGNGKNYWLKDPRAIGSDIVATQLATLTTQADEHAAAVAGLRPQVLSAGSSETIRHKVENGSGMFLFNAAATKELTLAVFGTDSSGNEKTIATLVVGANGNKESILRLINQDEGGKTFTHDGSQWLQPKKSADDKSTTIIWQNQNMPLKPSMQPYWFTAHPARAHLAHDRSADLDRTLIGFGYGAAPDKTLTGDETTTLGVSWFARFAQNYTITGFGIVPGSAEVTISQARVRKRLKGAGEKTIPTTEAHKHLVALNELARNQHKERVNTLLKDEGATTAALVAERAQLWAVYGKETRSSEMLELLDLIGRVEEKIITDWKAGKPNLATINAAYAARQKLESSAPDGGARLYHMNVRKTHLEPLRQEALSAQVAAEKTTLAEKFKTETIEKFEVTLKELRTSLAGMPVGPARTEKNSLIVEYANKQIERVQKAALEKQDAEKKARAEEMQTLSAWLEKSLPSETEAKYITLKKKHAALVADDAGQEASHYASLISKVKSTIQQKRLNLAIQHRNDAYRNRDAAAALATLAEQKAAVPVGDGDLAEFKESYDMIRAQYDTFIASRQQTADEMKVLERGKQVSDVSNTIMNTKTSAELAEKIAAVTAALKAAEEDEAEKEHQQTLLNTLQKEFDTRAAREKAAAEEQARLAEEKRIAEENAAAAQERRSTETSEITDLVKKEETTSTLIKEELVKVNARLKATDDGDEQRHLNGLKTVLNTALTTRLAAEQKAQADALQALTDRRAKDFSALKSFIAQEGRTLAQLEAKYAEISAAMEKAHTAGDSAEAFHQQQLGGKIRTAIHNHKKAAADEQSSEEKEANRLAAEAVKKEIITLTKDETLNSTQLAERYSVLMAAKKDELARDADVRNAAVNAYEIALSGRKKNEALIIAQKKMQEKAAKEAEEARLKREADRQKALKAEAYKRSLMRDGMRTWVKGQSIAALQAKQKEVQRDAELYAIVSAALATAEKEAAQAQAEAAIQRATSEGEKKAAATKAAHAAAATAKAEQEEAEQQAVVLEKENATANDRHHQEVKAAKEAIAAGADKEVATIEANTARTIAAKETVIISLKKKIADIEATKESRNMTITRAVVQEDAGAPVGLKKAAKNTVALSRSASLQKTTGRRSRSRVKETDTSGGRRRRGSDKNSSSRRVKGGRRTVSTGSTGRTSRSRRAY